MSMSLTLDGLLRRPATLGWMVLSLFTAIGAMLGAAMTFGSPSFMRTYGWQGAPEAVLILTFATFMGVLVGQVIRETQHCQFSWMLPRFRSRMVPGAVILGLALAFLAREILVGLLAVFLLPLLRATGNTTTVSSLWHDLPSLSLTLVAMSLLCFWIGARPSKLLVWTVLLPVQVFSPVLIRFQSPLDFTVAAFALPIVAVLIYRTFSVATARRRPFQVTQQVSGGGWTQGANVAEESLLAQPVLAGKAWTSSLATSSVAAWIRAGWYERHGWSFRWARGMLLAVSILGVAMLGGPVVRSIATAPQLWFRGGYGGLAFAAGGVPLTMISMLIVTTVIGVGVSFFSLSYGSIALGRGRLYPLGRQQRAAVEYRSSLVETLVIGGVLAAILVGFWNVMTVFETSLVTSSWSSWPNRFGGARGWALLVARSLAIVLVLVPVAQYHRLRFLQAPRPMSAVAQLLSVSALAVASGWLAAYGAIYSLSGWSRTPLIVHAAVLATSLIISQYIYQRRVVRYFERADLA